MLRIVAVVLVVLLAQFSYIAYLIITTPSVIRNPKLEHYHFRMQIVVEGKNIDFSKKDFQQEYFKDQCNDKLPEQPIHFHDEKDQIVHIHWEGITGGLVMKYYGWNYIGGPDSSLGYRLDKLTNPHKVNIHGKNLPAIPTDEQLYIYSGDQNTYKQRSLVDWEKQDLEDFFGVTSNFPAHNINKGIKTSMFEKFLPKAYAHGPANDAHSTDKSETNDEKITRINNLLGNVVIFAQKTKPTDMQIKEKFDSLIPLEESTCGG